MNPKLSIIVPIYNVEMYLAECIESLISQNYEGYEIILVNDGSTDSSGEICDQFSQKYSDIKVIHQSNMGLPHARNAGLDVATGEYVGFIDSDDFIHPDMYKKLISAMEESSADMAICNFSIYDKKGVKAILERYSDKVMSYVAGEETQWYDYAMDAVWNRLYKNEVIKEFGIRFEDKSIVAQEDFWFLIRYCSHIEKIVSVSDSLYLYRERGSSITRSAVDKDITKRCIDFVGLTEKYLEKSGRYSRDFLGQMTLKLMYASINQFSLPTPKDVLRTVKMFSVTQYFDEAVKQKMACLMTIKGIYDAFKSVLLRKKLYRLFSFIESLRVKRLHSQKNISGRFE